MCNLNAFDRLEKDASKLVAEKLTGTVKSLMSVSKKYTTDLKTTADCEELGLQEHICFMDTYEKTISGNSIALDLNLESAVIACVFYVNYKHRDYDSYDVVSEVRLVNSDEYNEDYLKKNLDKLMRDWVTVTKIKQDKIIQKAKERLAEAKQKKAA